MSSLARDTPSAPVWKPWPCRRPGRPLYLGQGFQGRNGWTEKCASKRTFRRPTNVPSLCARDEVRPINHHGSPLFAKAGAVIGARNLRPDVVR